MQKDFDRWNKNKVAWVLPMTTKGKNNFYYFPLKVGDNITISYLILSQIRLVSVKRFRRRVGRISTPLFQLVLRKIMHILNSA
ncbi:type II toxin-antitoxin system PemK/MazF family toxin [Candidatus Peregrinibacteria bacterium]|nr:MAG: type II toxin-antitoxin system PemK/MazF family toxin [Candidatus Peregrinibacteria bacterium]